jgi:hypothetical protein
MQGFNGYPAMEPSRLAGHKYKGRKPLCKKTILFTKRLAALMAFQDHEAN